MIFILTVILLLLIAAWFYWSGVREGQSYTVDALPDSMIVIGSSNSPIFLAEALKELLKNADFQKLLGLSNTTKLKIYKSKDGILFASPNPNISSINLVGQKILNKNDVMKEFSLK